MAQKHVTSDLSTDPIDVAVRQASRARRKGRHRQSMLLLRRAAFAAGERPGLWTRYAFSCMRGGKREDGRKAFAQAVWLLERTGQSRGADLTRRLAKDAEAGTLPPPYARHK